VDEGKHWKNETRREVPIKRRIKHRKETKETKLLHDQTDGNPEIAEVVTSSLLDEATRIYHGPLGTWDSGLQRSRVYHTLYSILPYWQVIFLSATFPSILSLSVR
jgi:hypothetical protein